MWSSPSLNRDDNIGQIWFLSQWNLESILGGGPVASPFKYFYSRPLRDPQVFPNPEIKENNMGQINIPGTSIQFVNPKQIDQTTNIDPLTGKVWKTSGADSFTFTYPNGVTGIGINGVSTGNQGVGTNLGSPQPGTFDTTAPTANPVIFGKQPPSLSAGGVQIPNSTSTIKNPA
jgi:hypothetical protein